MPTDAFVTERKDSLEDRNQDAGFRSILAQPTAETQLPQLPSRENSMLPFSEFPDYPRGVPVLHPKSRPDLRTASIALPARPSI